MYIYITAFFPLGLEIRIVHPMVAKFMFQMLKVFSASIALSLYIFIYVCLCVVSFLSFLPQLTDLQPYQ